MILTSSHVDVCGWGGCLLSVILMEKVVLDVVLLSG